MYIGTIVLRICFIALCGKMMAFGFVIDTNERKCKYLKMDRMLKIRCSDMNLKEVPQYLSTSVEVLDLSFNRIRRLYQHSFERYRKVKYLLLYENMIQSVEPDTFARLSSLQEIDLSNNALTTIPLDIFQLPSLRNLYVDSNELRDLHDDLEHLQKPIQAPLEYLNLADCGLQDLPNMGIVPYLWHVNASSNPLTAINTETFATMCHLTSIDLTKTKLPNCACHQIVEYASFRRIKSNFLPICHASSSVELDNCPQLYNITLGLPEFEQCNQETVKAAARSMWMMVAGCIGGSVIILLLVVCCVHRRKRRKAKKKKKSERFLNTASNANPQQELLSDNT